MNNFTKFSRRENEEGKIKDDFDECEEILNLHNAGVLNFNVRTRTSLSRSSSGDSHFSDDSLRSLESLDSDTCCGEGKHSYEGNVCLCCGEEINGEINYEKIFDTKGGNGKVQKSALNPKNEFVSLKEDLRDLNLNEDIQAEVFEMYSIVSQGKTHRKKLRKAILMACITNIYIKKGMPQDEAYLLKHFDLAAKDHSKGNKLVKLAVENCRYLYEGVQEHFSLLFRKVQVDNNFHEDIKKMYNKILTTEEEKDSGEEHVSNEYGPIFKNRNPKIIAAIVIYKWHVYTHSEPYHISEFAKMCDIPKYALYTAYRECDRQISILFSKK